MSETNRMRLLWAGFMAILAAGVGFGIRGGILDNWASEFGFTGSQTGAILGAGLTGFCFGIIIGGFIADKIGYGRLVMVAFVMHVVSAVVALAAVPEMGQALAYQCLFWGSFIFAVANGTLEAVANPLVATLFPEKRTHYLNILHASWPAGLVLGTACGWYLDDKMEIHWKVQLALFLIPSVIYGLMFLGQKFPKSEASQKGLGLGEMFRDVGVLGGLIVCYLLALFFSTNLGFDQASSYAIGVVLLVVAGMLTRQQTEVSTQSLGLMAVCILLGAYFQMAFKLPMLGSVIIGGALLAGLGFTMRWAVGAFLLFTLFIAHALVGAVELGTDGWIQNITGNILTSEQGKFLMLFTSAIMFALRFCADFIESKMGLSPVGILFVCAVLACVGLNMASGIDSFQGALLALGIYAVGKTFFWPTMLAVASDRYPRTGAVAISIMGGIGMLSAGLIGGPGLGYAKDRFATEALAETDKAVLQQYVAREEPKKQEGEDTNSDANATQSGNATAVANAVQPEKTSSFLFFGSAKALDGKKLGDIQEKLKEARAILEKGKEPKAPDSAKLEKMKEAEQKKAKDKYKLQQEVYAALKKADVVKKGGNANSEDAYKALTAEEEKVHKASIVGDRKTLVADSFIPAAMAVIYLLIMLYFRSIGGYRPVTIEESEGRKKKK